MLTMIKEMPLLTANFPQHVLVIWHFIPEVNTVVTRGIGHLLKLFLISTCNLQTAAQYSHRSFKKDKFILKISYTVITTFLSWCSLFALRTGVYPVGLWGPRLPGSLNGRQEKEKERERKRGKKKERKGKKKEKDQSTLRTGRHSQAGRPRLAPRKKISGAPNWLRVGVRAPFFNFSLGRQN